MILAINYFVIDIYDSGKLPIKRHPIKWPAKSLVHGIIL